MGRARGRFYFGMMGGYYCISHDLADPNHDLHPHMTGEPACRFGAWVDLIGMAKWKDGGGLKRGQLAHSERFLAARWNRPRSWVTRFLEELEEKDRIEREPQAGRKPGRTTVCNYDTYQKHRTTNGATSEPRIGPRIGPKYKEEEQEEDKPPIVPLWEVWVEEVWRGETTRSLTPKRKKKLEMVWKEQLEEREDSVEFFRKMVRAMLNDDWWGPKKSTHLPEKAMKNAERREDWAVAARSKRRIRQDGAGRSLKGVK